MAIPPRNKRKARFSPKRETKPPEQPHNVVVDMPSSSSSSSSWAVNNFSSSSTQPLGFPPGYEFVPQDDQLILHYLKPFLKGDTDMLLKVPIHRVNIYESNPQELSENFEKGNKKEWFFLSERVKRFKGGKHLRRRDNNGYWSATDAAKKIKAREGVVGYKTKLEYFLGKKTKDLKGDWLMKKFWVESSDDDNNEQVDYALCKIYLTPQAKKKKKAEEEENEKLKEVEHQLCNVEEYQQPLISTASLDPHQPNQLELQQLHDIECQQQQYCLLPAQDQKPQLQELTFPYNLDYDDFSELNGFEHPVIPKDFEDFFTEFNEQHSMDGNGESNNS